MSGTHEANFKENYESEKKRADLLEKKLDEETRKVSELTRKLAEYEGRSQPHQPVAVSQPAMSQQTGTQGGENQGKNTIPDYIQNLNAQARKLGTNEENVPRLEKAIIRLTENKCSRLDKLISHLCKESATDDCKFLAESAVLFFRILDVCTVKTNEARCFYFSALLDNLFTRKADLNAFVDIRNLFTEQSMKLSIKHLFGILGSVASKVTNATEKTVSEQWRDCVSILVSRLLEFSDRGNTAGASLASILLCQWLRVTANTTVFASIVAIIEKCGVSHILRGYMRVEAFRERLIADKDNDKKKKMETRSLTKPPQKMRFRRGDCDSEDEETKGQVPKKRQR